MTELKLDYDRKYKQKRISVSRIGFIMRKCRLKVKEVKAWKTISPKTRKVRGQHVRIWLKQKLTNDMVLILQALVGSDYARETFNLLRLINMKNRKYGKTMKENWNVLFNEKYVKSKLVSKEIYDEKLTKRLRRELIKMKKENYIVFDIETTGLNPWYGHRVTCICAKDSKGNKFAKVSLDEQSLIFDFFTWSIYHSIRKHYNLITKNGKLFDIPFLLSRLAMLGDNQTSVYAVLFWSMEHLDLQEITVNRISLNDLAKILGIRQKSASGLDAILMWGNKEYSKLKKYCMRDVEITEQIYLKRKELLGGKK